jgi:hypothetical protein
LVSGAAHCIYTCRKLPWSDNVFLRPPHRPAVASRIGEDADDVTQYVRTQPQRKFVGIVGDSIALGGRIRARGRWAWPRPKRRSYEIGIMEIRLGGGVVDAD